ncbi:hypothetical protein GYMLUDRAFT_245235 [Collybiopsis luxurians FD-317 M1]|uniref:Cupredoxin n=1 Tax=Collybiopsis luxurians FD-317 M1 TaxID=944289 RepID=A0A0D0CAT5_9AGAR|nr:hypothetical protein GYMLUDRAFT_245235 [Collybiopsis luxurians FD-317 M1]
MRYSTAAAAVLSAAASVHAATYNVLVGDSNNLVFNPTTLSGVANGDIVNFQFVSKNHSVVQSTFTAPCTAAGVSSGFQNVSDPTGASGFPTWSMTVENASAPLWFFCSQTTANFTHCQRGMVFAINPTANKSFEAFQNAALTSNSTSPPGQNPSGTIISGTPGATDGPVSVSGLGTASSESAATATASGAAATGTGASSGSGTDTGSAAGSTSTGSSSNGASQLMSGSSISLLAVAGLVAGLAL